MLKDEPMKDTLMKDACRNFRDRFQPGVRDPHRDRCTECSRFAEVLESSTSTEVPRPMPAGLRSRLRNIPQLEVTCRDVERLYREARRRAGAPTEHADRDSASEQHLATCERCREVYGTLQCAFEPERLTIPVRLARRLTDIAQHPERLIPLWISDTRYAAAACYLLATMTLAVADDASALLRGTTESVSSRVGIWATTGEAQRARAWDTVTSSIENRLEGSWNRALSYREAGERWVSDAYRSIEDTTRELIPDHDRSVEGEHNG